MTCYFRSKHADFAVESKETITEVVFDWQDHVGHHAASVVSVGNWAQETSGHSFNIKQLPITKIHESPALNI